MAKFPVGIQDFSRVITEDYLYVDKTELIYRLITEGTGYFMGRPRRFGKSLLVSTLDALFRGRRELFEGLWIDSSDYHWQTYPIINLDLSLLSCNSPEDLTDSLNLHLQEIADEYSLGEMRLGDPGQTFIALVKALAVQATQNRVVVLIDEYDRPLVNNLHDRDLVSANRDILNDFFVKVKSLNRYLQFVFVTGVSKFSKVSLFSGMNNLRDISLSRQYATLLGITDEELMRYLTPQMQHVSRERGESMEQTHRMMRSWYNGYRFSRSSQAQKVYNPLSVILFLQEAELSNYWFGTATPTFALELIKRQQYSVINFETGVVAGHEIEVSHEVDGIDLTTLLFQTGYLTISDYDEGAQRYFLRFPNEEVRRSFLEQLVQKLLELPSSETQPRLLSIEHALKEERFECFFEELNWLLDSIPYPIQVAQEAYYHSIIYVILRGLHCDVESEVMTGRGRLDMVLLMPSRAYIFEFKLDGSASAAMQQILDRGYYKRYLQEQSQKGRKVSLIGVNVSSQSRQIDDWVTEFAE